MVSRKLWADCMSDDDWSDIETSDSPASSIYTQELPFYVKMVNFPFKMNVKEVSAFLGLRFDEEPNLHLVCRKGKRQKFRGIVIVKVPNIEFGTKMLEFQGRTIQNRQISVEVLPDWIEERQNIAQTIEENKSKLENFQSGDKAKRHT